MQKRKIVVAIAGASGSIFAKRLLHYLDQKSDQFDEIGLIFSDNAQTIWKDELGDVPQFPKPIKLYTNRDFTAPFASGSAQFDTMVIVPCSAGVLGRVANGVSDSLMTRAADVMLKERRRLIFVLRETPYNLIHIKNMERVTQAGAIVCPATPSFYHNPQTIDEVVDTVVYRILDLCSVEHSCKRWGD